MPRQRRHQRAHVDLAGLIERAQQQQQPQQQLHQHRPHPHIHRSPKISAHPTRTNMFPADKVRSRNVRNRRRSRNTVIDVGGDIVWNTLVQPVSLLQWLPMRRTFRLRRSYRSRSRRSQRSGDGAGSGSALGGVGGVPMSPSGMPKIGSQTRMPAAAIEMPCCATESPTAEVQMMSQSRERCQQHQHDEQRDEQHPGDEHAFTPPLSAVILHQNPLFDAEGNTRSGLIAKNVQKAQIDRAKSRWNIRGACDKTPSKKQLTTNGNEPKDVARKKSAAEKRVPAKKGSGSDESSAASMNVSHSTVESGASSEKSKSDTEESNSFEESIDLTMHEELELQLDNVAPSRNLLNERSALLEAIAGNAPNNGTTIKPKNFETMLAK